MAENQAGGTWQDALVQRHPDLFQVGTGGRIPGRPTADDGRQNLVERAATPGLENVHIVRTFDGSRHPIACCCRYVRETDSFIDVGPQSLDVRE
jgi:hypothetical protein